MVVVAHSPLRSYWSGAAAEILLQVIREATDVIATAGDAIWGCFYFLSQSNCMRFRNAACIYWPDSHALSI